MLALVSARQRLLELQQQAQSLQQRYGALEDHAQAAARQVEAEHAEAIAELCAHYLLSLDDADLARAAQLTGFRGFERRDPRRARDHERHVLAQAIFQIRSNPQYQARDRLVGPGGELTELVEAARRELQPHQEACRRYEDLPDFHELIATNYDTPEFSVGWWRADYWRLWAAGDRICRELGVNDFGDDVLPVYRRLAEPRDYWKAEVDRLEREIDAIHTLVRQHDEAQARLANLDAIYLDQARAYLGEHVAQADLGLLDQWADADPAGHAEGIRAALRRVAGVHAKRGYLHEVVYQGIAPLRAQLEARESKYRRKLGKLARGKYLAPAEYADSLAEKAPKLEAQADKTRRRIDQLVEARNYDTFDPSADHHLWWWHFTESAPPRLLPSTHAWYQQHPELAQRAPAEPDAADLGQAFMAGRDAEGAGGYLS